MPHWSLHREEQGRKEGESGWAGFFSPPAPIHLCLINLDSLAFISFTKTLQHTVL